MNAPTLTPEEQDGNRYARDPSYPKPPNWAALYRKHCPHNTDGSSRHVKMLAEDLRDPKSEIRRRLIDDGREPDHWAYVHGNDRAPVVGDAGGTGPGQERKAER